MLALFGAPPPQATQTLPRLSLCLHACAGTAAATGGGGVDVATCRRRRK